MNNFHHTPLLNIWNKPFRKCDNNQPSVTEILSSLHFSSMAELVHRIGIQIEIFGDVNVFIIETLDPPPGCRTVKACQTCKMPFFFIANCLIIAKTKEATPTIVLVFLKVRSLVFKGVSHESHALPTGPQGCFKLEKKCFFIKITSLVLSMRRELMSIILMSGQSKGRYLGCSLLLPEKSNFLLIDFLIHPYNTNMPDTNVPAENVRPAVLGLQKSPSEANRNSHMGHRLPLWCQPLWVRERRTQRAQSES